MNSIPAFLNRITISPLVLSLLLAICFGAPASAQTPPQAPGPERIFIGNAGPGPNVGSQGRDAEQYAERAYNEFFVAMQQWGIYEIVADPARADWAFEISITNDRTCGGYTGVKPGARAVLDNYQVAVLMTDAHTHHQRAGLAEPIRLFRPSDSFDQIFDRAIANLVDDVKKEVGGSVTMTPLPAQNQPMAPIPSQIDVAQKVFVESRVDADNAGGNSVANERQLYDDFVAALQKWGRFQVVSQAEADLVFAIDFTSPLVCDYGADPQILIYIKDAKTDISLWAFASHVPGALFTFNAHRNVTQGIASLVTEIRDFTMRPTWAMNASLPPQPGAPLAFTPAYAAAQPGPMNASPSSLPHIGSVSSLAGLVHLSVPFSVKSGTKIMADVTVTNSTQQDLQFYYTQGDPLGCAVTVQGENGKGVNPTTEGAKALATHAAFNGQRQTYVLHPREKQTRQCELSTLYDMTAPGTYAVEVTELDGVPTTSNIAAVTVKP
ncbi:MAG TPA: hypothetical protein VGK22_06220 [Candidatus Angelobacter sp.]|jgi:hypothetical protein